MRLNVKLAAFTALAVASAPAAIAEKSSPRPMVVAKLIECQSVAEPAGRLACYDTQVKALETAESRKELVVIDQQQVRRVRQSLFGFAIPRFNLGGVKVDDSQDITHLESSVSAVRKVGYGWAMVLANDGGTWETSDPLLKPPAIGNKVEIKKGFMGGFLGSIGNNNVVRMRRTG